MLRRVEAEKIVVEQRIHDLRRTAARNMIRAGVPEKLVLDIVGWKTRAMLDRYNITDERDVHHAGEKLTRFHDERARLSAEREVRMKVRIAGEEGEGGTTEEHPLIQ